MACFAVINVSQGSVATYVRCGGSFNTRLWYGMVWYGMVNVDLYSTIITKVSNALNTLVSGEKPCFQTLSKGLVVLLCSEVVRQRVPDHGAVHYKFTQKSSSEIFLSVKIWQNYCRVCGPAFLTHSVYTSSVCSTFDNIVSSVCDKINLHRVPSRDLDITDIKQFNNVALYLFTACLGWVWSGLVCSENVGSVRVGLLGKWVVSGMGSAASISGQCHVVSVRSNWTQTCFTSGAHLHRNLKSFGAFIAAKNTETMRRKN